MRNSIFKSYTKKILRSEAFVSVIIVFVLALGIIGTSYALYMDVDSDTEYQLVEVGDLAVSFETPEGVITMENMLPMEDDDAIKSTENIFQFYIYNTGSYMIDYDIKLTPVSDTNTIEPQFINYQICRDNSENCSEVKTLGTVNEDNSVTINNPIYNDSLTAKKENDQTNPSAYYFLRLWLNNKYENEVSGVLQYKVEINAKNISGNLESTKTLAGAILNSARLAKETNDTERTQFSPTPQTTPLKVVSGSSEKTLSTIPDYYGTSYYFRGAVQDNYVLFNNLCWRIVRIEGDGSVKLTLAGTPTNNTCENLSTTGGLIQENGSVISVPYGEVTQSANYKEYVGGLYTELLNWYNKYFDTLEKKNNVKQNTLWCLGGTDTVGYNTTTGEQADLSVKETTYYFSAGKRFNITRTPSLMCGHDEDKEYEPVGTLTMDEVTLAGAASNSNTSFYLNEQSKQSSWWTLSLDLFAAEQLLDYDNAFYVTNDGIFNYNWVAFVSGGGAGVRPTISLIPETEISNGIGISSDPYIVS